MKELTINNLSRTGIKLQLYFNDKFIAHGTCFLFRHGSKIFVVTAKHNVLGRHPDTGENLSDFGAIPSRAVMLVAKPEQVKEGVSRVGWIEQEVPFYSDEDNLRSLWFGHEDADIAAVELSVIPEEWHKIVNDDLPEYHDFRPLAGMDAFVTGFPEDFTGGGDLPIWKRATIALEPAIAQQKGKPILIDTATRRGMSGAPAYAKDVGLIIGESIEDEVKPGVMHPKTVIGEAYRFLGVYTSRPLADDAGFKAQLGTVYPAKMIEEMLDSGTRGESPF